VPRLTGKDKFGRIRLTTGACLHCGDVGTIIRWHHGIEIPGVDLDARTLIININEKSEFQRYDSKRGLGINCGHYAAFHRQIAHIEGRRKG
jgi:hypothetical protein